VGRQSLKMKGKLGSRQAEFPLRRLTARPRAVMLHPDMFSGHSKEYESLIPSLQNSVRMRSLKQHSTQIRYKKDYDTFYESDPSRQLALLRKTRIRRPDYKAEADIFCTWSEGKPCRRRDSISLSGLKKGRLNLSEFVIDKVATAFEAEKFTTSVISADLKGILGEVNRVISSVTHAAGKLNESAEVKRVRRKPRRPSSLCLDNPLVLPQRPQPL